MYPFRLLAFDFCPSLVTHYLPLATFRFVPCVFPRVAVYPGVGGTVICSIARIHRREHGVCARLESENESMAATI